MPSKHLEQPFTLPLLLCLKVSFLTRLESLFAHLHHLSQGRLEIGVRNQATLLQQNAQSLEA